MSCKKCPEAKTPHCAQCGEANPFHQGPPELQLYRARLAYVPGGGVFIAQDGDEVDFGPSVVKVIYDWLGQFPTIRKDTDK